MEVPDMCKCTEKSTCGQKLKADYYCDANQYKIKAFCFCLCVILSLCRLFLSLFSLSSISLCSTSPAVISCLSNWCLEDLSLAQRGQEEEMRMRRTEGETERQRDFWNRPIRNPSRREDSNYRKLMCL